jgi:hypothetical protein
MIELGKGAVCKTPRLCGALSVSQARSAGSGAKAKGRKNKKKKKKKKAKVKKKLTAVPRKFKGWGRGNLEEQQHYSTTTTRRRRVTERKSPHEFLFLSLHGMTARHGAFGIVKHVSIFETFFRSS